MFGNFPQVFPVSESLRPRVGIKSPKIWRQIFEPYSRRPLGSILKYVPKGATKKKAKKASHMGDFILIMGLRPFSRRFYIGYTI
jgi:hypothetical protein